MKSRGPGKGGGQDPLTPLWTRLCTCSVLQSGDSKSLSQTLKLEKFHDRPPNRRTVGLYYDMFKVNKSEFSVATAIHSNMNIFHTVAL